jgi:uncharacterized membrane protein YphA (DoxX/SURF4 family)
VFPRSDLIITATGILEILGAIGLMVPRTWRAAALCLVLLLVALFPANVYAALNGPDGKAGHGASGRHGAADLLHRRAGHGGLAAATWKEGAHSVMIPRRTARRTASVRFDAPSLPQIDAT